MRNPPATPSVEFQDVAFTYAEGDPQALVDVGLCESGRARRWPSLVGPGAGKTTIAYLMMRFWDPDRGAIKLEGNRLEEFTLDDLRGHMALVAQDTYLFNEHDPREYPTRTSGRF